VNSQIFIEQLQESKLNGLKISLYHRKDIGTYMSKMGSHDPIWTLKTQVMVKRKVKSQIGNLTLDHSNSGIDLISLRVGGVRHTIGKLLRRATTLLQTSYQSKICTHSYGAPKSQESQLWEF